MTSSPPYPSPEVRDCMNAPTPLPSASAIRDGEDTTSPLLSLSPELRDRIYHFVLIDAQRAGTTQAGSNVFILGYGPAPDLHCATDSASDRDTWQWTHTSKQIFNEAYAQFHRYIWLLYTSNMNHVPPYVVSGSGLTYGKKYVAPCKKAWLGPWTPYHTGLQVSERAMPFLDIARVKNFSTTCGAYRSDPVSRRVQGWSGDDTTTYVAMSDFRRNRCIEWRGGGPRVFLKGIAPSLKRLRVFVRPMANLGVGEEKEAFTSYEFLTDTLLPKDIKFQCVEVVLAEPVFDYRTPGNAAQFSGFMAMYEELQEALGDAAFQLTDLEPDERSMIRDWITGGSNGEPYEWHIEVRAKKEQGMEWHIEHLSLRSWARLCDVCREKQQDWCTDDHTRVRFTRSGDDSGAVRFSSAETDDVIQQVDGRFEVVSS
jgi:hypothetical protein